MAGEFLPITKEVASRKKKMCVKLIYSIKTNTIISFFSKCLITFLRNSIKYVVSIAVLGALSGALKKRSFDWNETITKYIQISILTGKHLRCRLFKYSCRYEGLQLYEKVTPSHMLSRETYEVLQSMLGDCFWFQQ